MQILCFDLAFTFFARHISVRALSCAMCGQIPVLNPTTALIARDNPVLTCFRLMLIKIFGLDCHGTPMTYHRAMAALLMFMVVQILCFHLLPSIVARDQSIWTA